MANWLHSPGSHTARFGIAILASALATILQWAMQPIVGARIPFMFFLPTILLVATSNGRGPALLVLTAGLVNSVLLFSIAHPHISDISSPDAFSMLAYLVVGTVLAQYGSRLRFVTSQKSDIERRLTLAQTSTGIGLYEVDLNQRTVLGSPTFWELLNRPPRIGPVPLEEWISALHPEDAAQGNRILAEKMAEGVVDYEREDRVPLPDGKVRWLLSRIGIDRDAGGVPAHIHGAMGDISERKQTEALLERTQKELLQQVADLQRLHELTTRLVQIGDVASQMQLILQAFAEFHGTQQGLVSTYDRDTKKLTVRASLGFGAASIAQFGNVDGGEGVCGIACRTKQRIVIEDVDTDPRCERFRALAQEQGIRAVHCMPMISQAGEVLGAISVHFAQPYRPSEREIRLADICARKVAVIIERANAQMLAKESDQRFKVALESAAVPFSLLTPMRDDAGNISDFRWMYVNAAAATLLRRPVAEIIGARVQDIVPAIWQQPGLLENYIAVVNRNEVREFELHYRRRDGDGWFHVVASPMQGSVAAWYAEVSERKREEQSLREADQRKDEFLATLAHELRNPLAPIRQAALISKLPTASETQKRWSHEVIDRQIKHMALLLDDLLDISRITRGQLQLRKQPTDLHEVIDIAVETAKPAIDAKHHILVLELPPQTMELDADGLRLAQVIANLLTNAAKYTNTGGTIRLRVVYEDAAVVIMVKDNGIGISAAELPTLFRMFSQLKSAHERAEGGLGIGLALAKGLIELHGGNISASSEGEHRGSEFTVRLPLQAATTFTAQIAASEPLQPPMQSYPAPSGFSKLARKIVVADDNYDSAQSLATLLEMEGHEVYVAHNGEEAITAIKNFQPDLALLDIGMPKFNGYEVARHVRGENSVRGIKLVAITGWGQDNDKQRALEAGFDYHFTKPVDPQQLSALITSMPAI